MKSRFQEILKDLETQAGFNGEASDDTNEEAKWPPMSPLPTAPSVPTLPSWMVPEPLRQWLADVAERACIPLEMVACPAMVGLSAVIGRFIGIRPFRYDGYLVVPNLWGGVIARPGTLKTYAIDEGLRPLKQLAATATEGFQDEASMNAAKHERIEAEIDGVKSEMRGAAKKRLADEMVGLEIDLAAKREELRRAIVTERRYMTQDATVEKLGELLRENPRGLLVYRDELAGWLRTLDKPGREGDREFYLESWNENGGYTFDRIGRGTVHIPAVTVSIVGGIQPGKLKKYIQEAVEESWGADGLLQRLQLAVWPDVVGGWDPPERWPDTEAKNRAYKVFEYLDILNPAILGAVYEEGQVPYLRFAPDAQELIDSWRTELENRLRSGELAATPAFESHLSKYRSLMPSQALLFHLVHIAAGVLCCGTGAVERSGENSGVSLEAAQLAGAWCEFLEKHARKIYATELYRGVDGAHTLEAKIKEGAVSDGQSVRELYRHHWSGLSTQLQVAAALDVLVEAGWVRVESLMADTGGRPTEILHLHPDLKRERDE